MNYGLIQDELDPRDIFLDEIVAGDSSPIPLKYLTEGLKFENQGEYPFCASFSTTKIIEEQYRKTTGIHQEFSIPKLFFDAGGNKKGSGFRANLEVARKSGLISNALCPMPDPYSRDEKTWEELKDKASKTPYVASHKITGYSRLLTDKESLQKAILAYGAVLVGVYAKGGWWNPETTRKGVTDNHAVLLVGWDEKHWWIFDSITYKQGFDGYHTVSIDYTFNSAYVICELPPDYKIVVENNRQEYQQCLNRYSLPMNYMAEVQAENEMIAAFKKNGNQALTAFALRDKKQLINARAYGGYNFQYTKWGIWHAGDLINFEYSKMKGLKLPFNLDEVKK